MEFTIFDGINLTISAMLIVTISLSLIMAAILYVSRLIEKYERVQTLLKQAETGMPAPSPTANQIMNQPHTTASKKTLFEKDKLAKVAVLTALAHASEDEPDKRFEVVSIRKKGK